MTLCTKKSQRKTQTIQFVIVVGVVILLTLIGVWHLISLYQHQFGSFTPKTYNLIDGRDWSHIPGVVQDDAGVHVRPISRNIVNQDGTAGQSNPPVNVRGPHLEVEGNFRLDFGILNPSTKSARMRIYSDVPTIYDEWRYDGPVVEVELKTDSLVFSLWDGSQYAPVEVHNFRLANNSSPKLELIHLSNDIIITDTNTQLGRVSDHGIFDSHNIWFGIDADNDSPGWTLSTLAVSTVPNGAVKVINSPKLYIDHSNPRTLRNLAVRTERPIRIGVAVADYALLGDDNYRRIVGEEFSILTPENAMKPQFIHPLPGEYSFEDADALVDFAEVNGMEVHGHTLVFGEANPRWMQDTHLEQREQVMTEHIQTVVNHYKDRVAEWDVVNEPLADNGQTTTVTGMRDTIWYQAMGEQYIDIAFRAAHEIDPKAKLYLNEFGLESDGDRWDSMLALLQRLKSRNVPIDGVGFQAHVYNQSDMVNPLVLRRHIQVLEGLGLESRISEVDVTGDNESTQAEQYVDILRACLLEPSCKSFTTWGVTDKYGSTTAQHSFPPDYGNDLLWDTDYAPKASYRRLQAMLASQKQKD